MPAIDVQTSGEGGNLTPSNMPGCPRNRSSIEAFGALEKLTRGVGVVVGTTVVASSVCWLPSVSTQATSVIDRVSATLSHLTE
jgi:hypothetical protein